MSATSGKTVLAIDPGHAKCGLAVVRSVGEDETSVLWRRIAPVEDLEAAVLAAQEVAQLDMIIVGSGTRSRPIVEALRERWPSLGILVVDERDTTIKARERYWEHNPRRGWRRFLPATMQTPPEAVDDFVAIILAERVLTV